MVSRRDPIVSLFRPGYRSKLLYNATPVGQADAARVHAFEQAGQTFELISFRGTSSEAITELRRGADPLDGAGVSEHDPLPFRRAYANRLRRVKVEADRISDQSGNLDSLLWRLRTGIEFLDPGGGKLIGTGRLIFVMLLLATTCGPISSGQAYELRTHGEITREAYRSSLGMSSYLQSVGIAQSDAFDLASRTIPESLAQFENTGTAQDWVIEGVIREDDFSRSVIGIIFGCVQPLNPPSQLDRVFNHFLDVQRAGRGLSVGVNLGLPASDWALGRQGRGSGPSQNQFSLPDVRDYQYQSFTASSREAREKNTALMLRGLGHVLHVLEDMAQPQHTRNDPHADCADGVNWLVGGHSWYEDYIEAKALGRPFRALNDPGPLVLGGYPAVPTRPYQDFFSEGGLSGLADFSSRNFLSAGTNLGGTSTPCTGLMEPPCEPAAYLQDDIVYSVATLKGRVTAALTFYARDLLDKVTNKPIQKVKLTSRSLWDEHLAKVGKSPKFTLNRFNYDAMADVLLPRAVGYAVGFLDTFFRGSVGGAFEQQSLTISGSTEAMDGTFRVLYDTDDGTRRELASWVLRIEANTTSPVLHTAALPQDAAPGTPCWLIFRGQLGWEQNAVAGSRIACPYSCCARVASGGAMVRLPLRDLLRVPELPLRDDQSSARWPCARQQLPLLPGFDEHELQLLAQGYPRRRTTPERENRASPLRTDSGVPNPAGSRHGPGDGLVAGYGQLLQRIPEEVVGIDPRSYGRSG